MRPIVHLVAQNGDSGLATRDTNARAACSFAGVVATAKPLYYGGCARETFGSAGFRSRFANLRTTATLFRLATICWRSQQTERDFIYGKIHAPHRNRPDPGFPAHRHPSPTRRPASHG
ncbi:hypothetical protein EAH72_03100 [Pseudomonas caspiana]|nr:hypothetical protein EAH72_03100 [Pseudomonas caspiana]